jgi:hypothetical protein
MMLLKLILVPLSISWIINQKIKVTLRSSKIKGLIRRRESHAATRYIGLKDENSHFLDMPFYETGQVKKNQ